MAAFFAALVAAPAFFVVAFFLAGSFSAGALVVALFLAGALSAGSFSGGALVVALFLAGALSAPDVLAAVLGGAGGAALSAPRARGAGLRSPMTGRPGRAGLPASSGIAGAAAGNLLPRRPVPAPLDEVPFVTARLRGPRTGVRAVKIHPTPGTGFPPIRRPSSNSHGCSAWNSWNESLDRTWAPVRSATRRTKASPLPMAPAGGDTSSLWATASSNAWRSAGSIRCPKVASTTTMTSTPGCSAWYCCTASSSWARLGTERPSVAMFEPSTTA